MELKYGKQPVVNESIFFSKSVVILLFEVVAIVLIECILDPHYRLIKHECKSMNRVEGMGFEPTATCV